METRRTRTREEEALHELGTTIVERRTALLVSWAFVFVIALPLALSPVVSRLPRLWSPPVFTPSADAPPAPPDALVWNLADDEPMHSIEKQAVSNSLFPTIVQPATQHVLYALGRGTDSVFVGRGDTLIYANDAFPLWGGEEAVEPHDGSNEMRGVDAAVKATLSFAQKLAARGISLLVLPIPPGITLHPEWLGGAPGGVPLKAPSYTEYVERVRGAGVPIVDLATVFAQAPDRDRLYLRRNTHWTGTGLRVAAEAVARRATRMAVRALPTRPSRDCTMTPVHDEVRSDLLLLMHLPTTEGERTESATAFIPSLRGAGVVLSEKANVLVIGDSFNDGLLAQSIGCSLGGAVDRITVSGGGASVVRQIVATRPERLSGKALVVWEFAARDLAAAEWIPITF